ncbi:MAG: YraN family protein [Planctomycetaceae bacterium]|nr:YraN family protein [Planctomycetaceae bacterium]
MAKNVRSKSAAVKPLHRSSVSPKEKDVLGRAGEKAAADFLKEKGYKILQQNYLLPDGEIDIAARDGQMLVIVEVKTRKSNSFGKPYEAVTETKQRRMIKLARQFMVRFRVLRLPVRFDIVSITGTTPEDFEIEHFAEAFNPWDLQ